MGLSMAEKNRNGQSQGQRIFISHSSRDKDTATQLVNHLESTGLSCWIAPRDVTPGMDYNAQITAGIRDSRLVLLLESEHASASEQVVREIDAAAARKLPVIPVRIAEYQRSEAFEHLLRTYQWVDAFPSTIDRYFDSIVESVNRTLGNAQESKPADPNAVPKYIGPYRVLKLLGEGGMGSVFQAEQRKPIRRTVALKRIKPGLDSKEILARFESERQALARMDHPNIARVLDAGSDDFGRPFFVMEYVPGNDLSKIVRQTGRVVPRDAIEFVLQAAQGLQYAHSNGVVHRDIKPANLLFDGEKTVKILDLGLARLLEKKDQSQSGLTQTGSVMGTVDFMAPEQAEDTKCADARSDIYSLGCTMYFLLTGRTVFGRDTFVKKLLAHRNEPIPSLFDEVPDAPTGLETILKTMLAKRPRHRFQTMDEVVLALEGQRYVVNAASSGSFSPSEELQTDVFINRLHELGLNQPQSGSDTKKVEDTKHQTEHDYDGS